METSVPSKAAQPHLRRRNGTSHPLAGQTWPRPRRSAPARRGGQWPYTIEVTRQRKFLHGGDQPRHAAIHPQQLRSVPFTTHGGDQTAEIIFEHIIGRASLKACPGLVFAGRS